MRSELILTQEDWDFARKHMIHSMNKKPNHIIKKPKEFPLWLSWFGRNYEDGTSLFEYSIIYQSDFPSPEEIERELTAYKS